MNFPLAGSFRCNALLHCGVSAGALPHIRSNIHSPAHTDTRVSSVTPSLCVLDVKELYSRSVSVGAPRIVHLRTITANRNRGAGAEDASIYAEIRTSSSPSPCDSTPAFCGQCRRELPLQRLTCATEDGDDGDHVHDGVVRCGKD